MPASSNTAITGTATSAFPATMSPTGSKSIGLVFWLDQSNLEPARLKYTFYDDQTHGTLAQYDTPANTGEYRVLI